MKAGQVIYKNTKEYDELPEDAKKAFNQVCEMRNVDGLAVGPNCDSWEVLFFNKVIYDNLTKDAKP